MIEATFLRRYKRFFADVELENGQQLTVHCANTGRMTGCLAPGGPCRIWDSQNPKRKLRYSLEHTYVAGAWILVNTARINAVVGEALRAGRVPGLVGAVASEVKCGESRLDFRIGAPADAWVEVKSATWLRGQEVQFPDAPTTRGARHLRELAALRAQGERAVLFFCVGTEAGDSVAVANDIDADYAIAMARALAVGVEVMAWRVQLSPSQALLSQPVPYRRS